MRWVHLTVIILLVAATLLFVLQNRDVVTISFLGFSVRAPFAILIAVVYVIGAVTGGEVRLGATHPALGPRQGCQRWAQSSPERWIVLDARILCEDDYSSQGCMSETRP